MSQFETSGRKVRTMLKGLGVLLILSLFFMGCDNSTSSNDEDTDAVFRVMLENIGSGDVSYAGTVTYFYGDSSDSVTPPSGSIGEANEVPVIMTDSNPGAVGVRVNIDVTSETGTLRVSVRQGEITNGNFSGAEVISGQGPGGSTIELEYGSLSDGS